MFSEDYIVRIIRQATAAVAAALGFSRAGRQDEALAQLDQTLQQFWGLSLGVAEQLPVDNLLALARWEQSLDFGKLVVLAEVLQAEGEIYAGQGRAAESDDRRLKALAILLELALAGGQADRQALAPRLDALLGRLTDAVFPAELNDRLAAYYADGELAHDESPPQDA